MYCTSFFVITGSSRVLLPSCVRWASKKAGGSSKNGRKSPGKRLGLKCGDGESCVMLLNDSSVTPLGVWSMQEAPPLYHTTISLYYVDV